MACPPQGWGRRGETPALRRTLCHSSFISSPSMPSRLCGHWLRGFSSAIGRWRSSCAEPLPALRSTSGRRSTRTRAIAGLAFTAPLARLVRHAPLSRSLCLGLCQPQAERGGAWHARPYRGHAVEAQPWPGRLTREGSVERFVAGRVFVEQVIPGSVERVRSRRLCVVGDEMLAHAAQAEAPHERVWGRRAPLRGVAVRGRERAECGAVEVAVLSRRRPRRSWRR